MGAVCCYLVLGAALIVGSGSMRRVGAHTLQPQMPLPRAGHPSARHRIDAWSGLPPEEYERKKAEVADAVVTRLESYFPGLGASTVFRWGGATGLGGACLGRRLERRPGDCAGWNVSPLRRPCREVGTPRTHRRFLNRADGSYGPIPSRRPLGELKHVEIAGCAGKAQQRRQAAGWTSWTSACAAPLLQACWACHSTVLESGVSTVLVTRPSQARWAA